MPEARATDLARCRKERRYRLGLVLSGGGTRGMAHIGVLRALAQHGIYPDCVAGVSVGAIIGAIYASGHSPRKILEFFLTTDPRRFASVALTKPGIWDSLTFAPDLRRYLKGDRFEALRRKLFVVATDLLSGEPAVFDSGPLVLPLLASASLPMIYSPLEIDGRWYVDGGIVDNFPVQLVRERCAVVIGVHVSPLRDVAVTELNSSIAVLERALDIGMFLRSRERFAACDVVIQSRELARFGMFDTKHVEEIEALGYRETIACLPQIRQCLRARSGRTAPANTAGARHVA